MKPTKKIESEVLKVYDTWLYSYLNGDVETYSKYLDDDYHFIGSTNNEEFLSRNDTSKFFADTYEQLAGKCDLRKETRIIEQFGELVFITHLFDGWFLNGPDLAYYGRFRFTNALRKNQDGWRFIYQHFSTPDSKTEDGETIAFNNLNEENAQLREAVKRRTVELEQKNRELQIEAALERVRAKSMEMYHSGDLKEVVAVLYEQINRLKIAAWGSGIMIFNEPKNYQELWLSTDDKDIHPSSYKIHGQEHRYIKELWQIWKKQLENQHIDLIGHIKEDYDNYVFTKTELKNLPTKTIKAVRSMPDSYASFAWMKCGLLTLYDATSSLSEASFVVMRRFAKVFDQAYTRFLDLQKAEAQAREAQIEAALERVRSRLKSFPEHSIR